MSVCPTRVRACVVFGLPNMVVFNRMAIAGFVQFSSQKAGMRNAFSGPSIGDLAWADEQLAAWDAARGSTARFQSGGSSHGRSTMSDAGREKMALSAACFYHQDVPIMGLRFVVARVARRESVKANES